MYAKPGRTRYFIILLFLYATTGAMAQVVSDWEKQAADFVARVKNIEFFIDRFNGQPDGTGKVAEFPADSSAHVLFLAERRHRIFALFDLKQLKRDDMAMKEKLLDFFSEANNPSSPVFLRFDDRDWLTEIDFEVDYAGKTSKLRCDLQVQKSSEGVYTWNIRSFESPVVSGTEKADSMIFFPPSVHGTDFMEVRLKLQDKNWLSNIAQTTKKPSQTLSQLASQKLRVNKITKIRYRFLQVPGWVINVDYVNRSTPDSGWLIHSVERLTSEEKTLLMATKSLRSASSQK